MNKKLTVTISLCFTVFSSCLDDHGLVRSENEKTAIEKSIVELTQVSTKKFKLDSVTAPRAQYSQIYNEGGRQMFTFLNKNNNVIYFYDYDNLKFEKKITLKTKGFDEAINPGGYYIKNMDSIYVYNMASVDLLMTNEEGTYYKRISLIGNKNLKEVSWTLSYPQYYPQTAIPFIATPDKLLLPGQYMMSLPDSIIDKFKFTAYLDFEKGSVDFHHLYPRKFYGANANWEGDWFTEAYADLTSSGNQLVFSFPVSHDLYIGDLESESYHIVYGGSRDAGTISSWNAKIPQTSREMIMDHFVKNDEYGPIKYDPYRKLYYRFLRKAIPNPSEKTVWQDKIVSVVIMNEQFHYLGETVIGKLRNWYVQDVFVTREGLNLEYIENNLDEEYLVLRIFTVNKKI